jgi:glycosyltransferase involved in cell wall biosynthesis
VKNINKSTISVLLVSFNHEDYIYEALEGIRLQTRTPDEVLIADDGSTDKTQRIIVDYVKKNKLEEKWKLMLSSKNRGINANLNNAIRNLNAEIIVPMSGDDISLSNRCELAQKIFDENKFVNIINTNGFIINQEGEITGHTSRPLGLYNDIFKSIRNGFPPISPVGECWRRNIFRDMGELPTDVPNEDDQISFWGLINGGIFCSSERTFKYRVHEKSASAWLRNNQSNEDFLNMYLQDMEIRRRHMVHWHFLLSKSALFDKKYLSDALLKKIYFYGLMTKLSNNNYIERIIFLLKYSNLLPIREKVYCILGERGIVLWRILRRAIKGNK